jgi:hypothetical protein
MDSVTLRVLGLYRAEFEAAKRAAKGSAVCDWSTAVVATIGLFAGGGTFLYGLAIASVVLATGTVYFRLMTSAKKGVAEKGRRAVVLADGLGKPIEGKRLSDLRTTFSVSETEAKAWEDPNYYESTAPAGAERLAAMVQESAFWSRYLYLKSARRSWMFFILFALVSFGFLLGIVTVQPSEWRMKLAQVSCLIVALLLARDHLGRAISFTNASHEADAIDHRLEGNVNLESVLLAFGDYNCITESTPLVESGLYRTEKALLSQIWQDRKTR